MAAANIKDCEPCKYRRVNNLDMEFVGSVCNAVLLDKPVKQIQEMISNRIATDDNAAAMKIHCSKLHICKSLLRHGSICKMHKLLCNAVSTITLHSPMPPHPPPPPPPSPSQPATRDISSQTEEPSVSLNIEDTCKMMTDGGRFPVCYMQREMYSHYTDPVVVIRDSVIQSVIRQDDPATKLCKVPQENPSDQSQTLRMNYSNIYVVINPNTPLSIFAMRFFLPHHRFNIIRLDLLLQFCHSYLLSGGYYDSLNQNILIADEEMYKVTQKPIFHISELPRLLNWQLIAADNRARNPGNPDINIGYFHESMSEDYSDLQVFLHPTLHGELRIRNLIHTAVDAISTVLEVKMLVWDYAGMGNYVTNTIRSLANTPLGELAQIKNFHWVETDLVVGRMVFPHCYNARWDRFRQMCVTHLPVVGSRHIAENSRIARMNDKLHIYRHGRCMEEIIGNHVNGMPPNMKFLQQRCHKKMSHFATADAVDRVLVQVHGGATLASFPYNTNLKMYSDLMISPDDINGGLAPNAQASRPVPRLVMMSPVTPVSDDNVVSSTATQVTVDNGVSSTITQAQASASGTTDEVCVTDDDPLAIAGPSGSSRTGTTVKSFNIRDVFDTSDEEDDPQEEQAIDMCTTVITEEESE